MSTTHDSLPREDGMHLLDRADLDVRWIRRTFDLKGIGRTKVISIRPLEDANDVPNHVPNDVPNDGAVADRSDDHDPT